MGIMSPITGNLFDTYGARKLSIIGMFILTIGTIPFIFLNRDTPVIYIVFLYIVRMFGISMVAMPITTWGMNSLPYKLISHGTAVNNTIRQVATSVGTAIMVSVLSDVTKANKPSHTLLHQAPLQYKEKYFDATLMGYHASFRFAVAFCVIGFALTFFIRDDHHEQVVFDEEENDQNTDTTKGGAA